MEKKKTGWDRKWKGRNEGEIEGSRRDGGKDRNSKSDKEMQRGSEKKPL